MNVIESRTTGITVKMNSTREISSITISSASYVNGANTTYLFIIYSSIQLISGDVLTIKLPAEITISINPFCYPESYWY